MNDKPWSGRFKNPLNKIAERFSSSISVDNHLALYDIDGSMAHILMLKTQDIISNNDFILINEGLKTIREELKNNTFTFKKEDEDIHMAIEKRLIDLIGSVGGKIHTARSRNDQVILDVKLYLIDQIGIIQKLLSTLLKSFINIAENNFDAIMPGYTHLQPAQPILFSHYIMTFFQMFKRDYTRFYDSLKRIKLSPLGAAAIAGTNFNINRYLTSEKLGFIRPTENSIDTVSDRDYLIETLNNIAISQMHLSRLAEDFIIFSSFEYSFIKLPDEFCTGSSIMPQKRNPDILELIRGKSGSVFGNLFSLLVLLKGLPLSYNRDLQEDKEPLFKSIQVYKDCLELVPMIIDTIQLNKEKMRESADKGYTTATDLADYLALKGLPFREAHKITGNIVLYATESNKTLDQINIEEFKTFSPLINDDIYNFINIENSIKNKKSYGGTSPDSVKLQIKEAKEFLNEIKI